MVVKAAPAMPAMPQPMAKVNRSVFWVLMPMALAIVRLLTVARTRRPQRLFASAISTPPVTTAVSASTNRPLIGMSSPGCGAHEPISQPGSVGLTSLGPMKVRKLCCIARLMPQVASRVSSGRL